jgi:hypothetical protein
MSNGPLTNWKEVQAFLQANSGTITGSPHGAFWNTLTYDQFVNHCVPDPNGVAGGPPCVTDASGKPVQILIKGNSKDSNIILALKGLPPFDGSFFNQMPDGGPYWTTDMVDPLAAWIDAGCPE